MKARVRRWGDRLSLYLPVLLMGLLALGTWWLVRNAPTLQRTTPVSAPRHEPDYTLHGFSVKTFDASGALQSEVQGRVAHHYPDTDTLEIEQVRLRSFSPEGRVTLASARQGVSNADGSQVQLRGEARVTREALRLPGGQYLPRLQFEGEFLHAWTQEERVRSHLPVTLLRERDRFSADSMEFDNLTQVLHMQGRVRGELQSPRRSPR